MSDHTKSNADQYIGFFLGEEEFGIGILDVKEIIEMKEITEVPRTPEEVLGVMNLRGNVIPVIDLWKKFGLSTGEPTNGEQKKRRIIVVEFEDIHAGFLVDGVTGVLRVQQEQIESRVPALEEVDRSFFRGVANLEDRLVILVNLDEILSVREQSELQSLEEQ